MPRHTLAAARTLAVCALPTAIALLPRLHVQASPTAPDRCAANLKLLGSALASYTQDYDGALPPMQTAGVAQAALAPYTPSRGVFACPVTKKPYQPNSALSSQVLAKVAAPGDAELYADSVPHPDGRTVHLYADGHIMHTAAKAPARKGAKP